MKKVVKLVGVFIVLLVIFTGKVFAGVPFTNLEGVGGAAFNPFAYPANSDSTFGDPNSKFGKIFSKPQIGVWYVNLGDVKVNWTSIGVSETLFKRLELSYSQEHIYQSGQRGIRKDNLGAKFLLIEENSWDTQWVPAISIGAVAKQTSFNPSGVDSSGVDYYIVATKMITKLPMPVLLSGGLVSTNSRTTGVYGFTHGRDVTWFGNIDVLPRKDIAIGVEYKQGAALEGWENANYWDAHVAWFVNKNLTLLASYVNAGNEKSSRKVGLGDGVVFSLQYAF